MNSLRQAWREIPEEVLLKVLLYLEDEDRTQISQVCKSWHQVYQHPSLWRSVSFSFIDHGRPHPESLQNLRSFIQQRGRHVRDLRIECPPKNMLVPGLFSKCVHTLLSGLSELPEGTSMLKSFKLMHLNFNLTVLNLESLCQLMYCIPRFLRDQTCLQALELNVLADCNLFGQTLIKGLLESPSSKTLKSLNIIGFLENILSLEDMRNLFTRCCMLQEIRLNYSNLYPGGLGMIRETLGATLKHLAVTVTMYSQQTYIPKEDWEDISQRCPRLTVSFHVCVFNLTWRQLLFPSIPLVELVHEPKPTQNIFPDLMYEKMAHLLLRLAECSYVNLRSVSIRVFSARFTCVQPPKEALIDCLVKCPNIRELNFSSQLMTYSLKEKVRSDLLQNYQLDKDVIKIVCHQLE